MSYRNRGRITPKEQLVRALQKGRRYKFRELRSICGTTDIQLRELIDECRRDGMRIVYGRLDRCFFLSTTATPYSDTFDMTWLPNRGILGLISDTHLCSDADRVDLCEKAYDRFVQEGIKTVIHAGDITDGWEVYRGHAQHIKTGGVQNQAVYAIEKYPLREVVKTFFICGNHDLKAYEKQGVDVGSLIVNGFTHNGKIHEGRKDLVYLGQYSRILQLPNEVTIDVIHPHGGSAYAVSYPQQKRAREMRTDTRPNMQISGHFHTWSHILQDYTHFLALMGMQDETEFFRRLGYGRQMGFAILEYELDFIRFKRIRVECVSFVV